MSLVERAAEAVNEEDARRMEEKMRKGQFTLEDFLNSCARCASSARSKT